MIRFLVIAAALLAVAATIVGMFTIKRSTDGEGKPNDAQRITRENFFGSGRRLPTIEEGQEVRPQW